MQQNEEIDCRADAVPCDLTVLSAAKVSSEILADQKESLLMTVTPDPTSMGSLRRHEATVANASLKQTLPVS